MKKVITIQQPCASLCVHTDDNGKAFKQFETRSWNTKYRGELLIHASAKPIPIKDNPLDKWCTRFGRHYFDNCVFSYGEIIGSVNLVNVYRTDDLTSPLCKQYTGLERISEQEEAFGDYSPGRYGWLFSDPVMFENPLPIKGQLGLWNLPLELIATARVEKEKSIARNMTLELLKEVYICNDLHRLVTIWNEIVSNKYNLSLTEIRKANNSIREQIIKSTASESDRLKYSNMLRDAMPQIL